LAFYFHTYTYIRFAKSPSVSRQLNVKQLTIKTSHKLNDVTNITDVIHELKNAINETCIGKTEIVHE